VGETRPISKRGGSCVFLGLQGKRWMVHEEYEVRRVFNRGLVEGGPTRGDLLRLSSAIDSEHSMAHENKTTKKGLIKTR